MDYLPATHSVDEIKYDLKTTGFVYLKGFKEDFCLHLLEQLGVLILMTDVVVDPEKRNMVTSSEALDFHTDHFKARYIVWYCVKQTDRGGESKLVDAKPVYETLPKFYQERLQEIHLMEHQMFEDDSPSNPLVTIVDGEPHFYYSFWLVKDEDKSDSALAAFRRGITNSKSLRLKLESGDLLIVDNHRILHGRTAIKGSKDRFLKRFWIA